MKVYVSEKPNTGVPCDVQVLAGSGILPAPPQYDVPREGCLVTPLYEDSGLLCSAALLPGRNVIQPAITLRSAYSRKTADRPRIFRAGGVLCAITADADSFRPEIFRYLAFQGVRVVFCQQYIPAREYSADAVIFGPWSSAQANNLFVVSVSNMSCDVIAPCALTDDGSGFIVRGAAPGFSADIPVERFYEGQRSFPVFQSLNTGLYSRLFRNGAGQCAAKKSPASALRVSAVSYALRPLPSLDVYRAEIEELYKAAAADGSRLIAFPELFGITPLCAMPLVRQIFSPHTASHGSYAADSSPCPPASCRVTPDEKGVPRRLIALFSGLIRKLNSISGDLLSSMSAKYHMYTASGSALEITGGRLFNVQTLYGPDGAVVGKQRKINPMESELSAGINYSDDILAFDTEIGRLAIPVCMDASYPENFRVFREMGVDLVALGTFNMEEYDPYLALRGIVPRCTEYSLHAVKAAMNGRVFGIPVTGNAELAVPCSEKEGGLLMSVPSSGVSRVITGEIFPSGPVCDHSYRQDRDAPVLRELLKDIYSHA